MTTEELIKNDRDMNKFLLEAQGKGLIGKEAIRYVIQHTARSISQSLTNSTLTTVGADRTIKDGTINK